MAEYACPHIRCEPYGTCQFVEPENPGPCQCHTSFAYIVPTHGGHCCFFPASQTCHPAEVAEWERQRDLRREMMRP